MKLYGNELMDCAETCMEAIFHLVCSPVSISNRFHDGCIISSGFVNPNIATVCNHPTIESLVVDLFNQYGEKSTDTFARHSVQLLVVFITHDNNAKYRPVACELVVKALQRHSDSELVVALCASATKLLRTNIRNKEKIDQLINARSINSSNNYKCIRYVFKFIKLINLNY